MKNLFLLFAVLCFSGCVAAKHQAVVISENYQASSSPAINITDKIFMKLSSPDFSNGGFFSKNFSCQGEGQSPRLIISGAPTGTVSFALILDDPDAGAGVFTHWLAWNIETGTTTLDIKKMPRQAIIGVNTAGTNKFLPPCPGSGLHHYYYRLYALDKKLSLSVKSGKSELLKEIAGHILAEAVLLGQYEKKQ
jgi:Raf kinase inhibitor-like YbhB/YbcL family protein